jgi:putative membrane protein
MEPPPAAYCGAPPIPQQLWARWNLDPALIAGLVVCLAAYLVGARRADLGRARQASFMAGWAAAALALVSPLCALSVALFSARVGQHMFLAAVAAPLTVLGRPGVAACALLGASLRPRRTAASPLIAAVLFALALWGWHAPAPYAATFGSMLAYWTMHLSLFGSALWLWAALFEQTDEQLAAALAAAVLTGVQMSLLGAIVTFAPNPLYAPHLLTTAAWGLTPLEDQQVGGALMWVPAGVIFVGALARALARLFARAERRALPQSIA